MAAEYEVNIKINSQQVTRQLGDIDKAISKISKTASNVGKPKGGSSRRKPGIAGLLPSSEELKAAERGLVQLTVKTKNLQNIAAKAKDLQSVQAKFSERRTRALTRSNALNEKELRLSQRLTFEARTRLRLLSQSGAKRFDATRPQGRQMADDIDARLKAQEKSARLANRINELEVKGVNVAKHRKQLGKIRTAQANSNFGLAEREIRVLRKSLELEQSKLRILKEQSNAVKTRQAAGLKLMSLSGKAGRLAGRAEAIAVSEQAQLALPSAQMLGGEARGLQRIETAGELRLRFAERIARAEQRSFKANKEALKVSKASATAGAKRAQAAVDEAKAAQSTGIALRKLASQFTPLINRASKLSGDGAGGLLALPSTKQLAAQARGIKRIETSEERRARFAERRLKAEERSAQNNKKALETSKQSARAAERAALATERQAKATAKQSRLMAKKRLEGVALGAGFPALFGGGAGSIIGGGLGGLTGSFGAQIALSAIGQQIDQFVAGMVDAGKALTSVGGAADFMAEKSLFSSDAMQFRIEKLIEEGKVTEAAALMTQEMAKQVGGSGLKALKDLGTEASKMGKIFSTLLIRVQAFLAKALTPLLKMINIAVGGITAQSQLDTMLAEARSPEERARMLARSEELRGVRRNARTGKAMGLNRTTPEVIEQLQKEFSIAIPKGAAIEPTGLEVLRAADSGADKAAKDKERMADIARRAQERLQIMQQEGDLAKELKKLDFERAAEIEKINKLENVGLEERQNAVQATNDLFDAQKGQAIGEALAKDLQTAIDLKKAQEDVLRPLEDQRRLLQGKLDGNEKEVRLQLEIENIMRSVKGLNEEDVENAVRKNVLLQEQIAVVEELDQVYASIGQSITSGIVDSLTAAVEGTKSLADVASQTLRQVANILLQFGVQNALSSLGGSDGVGFFSKLFPQRALGGSVSANQPYMVGERGPELFVPGAQGNIVPNNAMGGSNIVVNVDASGSNVQGDQPNAKALGQAIGAAVQAELIKQKRPGGLLS